jgi:hypothetical protein
MDRARPERGSTATPGVPTGDVGEHADLDGLAAALAALLAAWWRRREQEKPAAGKRAASAGAGDHADATPGVPTRASLAVADRPERGVGR